MIFYYRCISRDLGVIKFGEIYRIIKNNESGYHRLILNNRYLIGLSTSDLNHDFEPEHGAFDDALNKLLDD